MLDYKMQHNIFLFSIKVIIGCYRTILTCSFSSFCLPTLCLHGTAGVGLLASSGFGSDLSPWTGVLSWGAAKPEPVPGFLAVGPNTRNCCEMKGERGLVRARSMDHRETASVQGDRLKIWIDPPERVQFRQSSPERSGYSLVLEGLSQRSRSSRRRCRKGRGREGDGETKQWGEDKQNK